MNAQLNGWTVLALLGMLVLSYGVGYLYVNAMQPAVAAQIGANQQVVGQVNQAFEQMNKTMDTRFAKVEARLETLEKR